MRAGRKSLLLTLLIGLAGAVVMPQPAQATPIPIGGLWQEFSFVSQLNNPASIHGCSPADPAGLNCIPSSGGNSTFVGAPPWTFLSPGSVELTVTDAFRAGDEFGVFDNNSLIGSTSSVTPDPLKPHDCGDDPVPCSMDPLMSHGVFDLGPGAHSITMTRIASAPVIHIGAAYFRTDPVPVPEPASVLLLGSGLPAMVLVRRKMRRRQAFKSPRGHHPP